MTMKTSKTTCDKLQNGAQNLAFSFYKIKRAWQEFFAAELKKSKFKVVLYIYF